MTRRNLAWRGAGALLMGSSAVAGQLGIGGPSAGLAYFVAALFGIVLMANGHHVLTVLRAERRGHGLTPQAVHAARVRRRAPKSRPRNHDVP